MREFIFLLENCIDFRRSEEVVRSNPFYVVFLLISKQLWLNISISF